MTTSAAVVTPISNFETNAGTFRGGKNRRPIAAGATTTAAAPVVKLGASSEAFQQFRAERQAKGTVKSKRVPQAPALSMKPTKQRLEKADKPAPTKAGNYRAPAPIERLRDQGKLDPTPTVNLGMYQAAEKLYAHFYRGGLKGIKAQDLSRATGSGDGGACQFPASEDAMYHRQKFREATRIMGWYIDAPYRGAGRLVVDVVCFEMPVEDASRKHSLSARTDTIKANGMEKLCEGLFILAAHWRLI